MSAENVSAELLEIIACPACHALAGRPPAWSCSARAADSPTRSATASRSSSSTRPQPSRDDRRLRRLAAGRRGRARPGRRRLRPLAEAGARVRREAVEVGEALAKALDEADAEVRPRAVVAAGPDSRLLRAVLEPWCPVPFVAWPNPSLPGWAGSLDLVVVLAPEGGDTGAASAVAEAHPPRAARSSSRARRGRSSPSTPQGRHSTVLPADSGDQLATAVVMLQYLYTRRPRPRDRARGGRPGTRRRGGLVLAVRRAGGQPRQDARHLAGRLHTHPLGRLGARRARRAADRRVDPALQRPRGPGGDAEHLLPILASAQQRDVFADPFSDDEGGEPGPALVMLDDGAEDAAIREARGRLVVAAQERGIRVETIASQAPQRRRALRSPPRHGRYAAAYLGVGLSGRESS